MFSFTNSNVKCVLVLVEADIRNIKVLLPQQLQSTLLMWIFFHSFFSFLSFLTVAHSGLPKPQIIIYWPAGDTCLVFLESLKRQCKRFYYRRNLSLKPFSCKCLEACSVWRFVSLKRSDLTSCILSVKLGDFHCWPILGMERQNTPALLDLQQM